MSHILIRNKAVVVMTPGETYSVSARLVFLAGGVGCRTVARHCVIREIGQRPERQLVPCAVGYPMGEGTWKDKARTAVASPTVLRAVSRPSTVMLALVPYSFHRMRSASVILRQADSILEANFASAMRSRLRIA